MSRRTNNKDVKESIINKNINLNNDDDDDDDEDDEDYVPNKNDKNNDESDNDSVDSEEEEENDAINGNDTDGNKTETKKTIIDEDKLNKIWEEFNSAPPVKSSTATAAATTKTSEMVTITKEYDFAGEKVTVEEQVEKSKINNNKFDKPNSSGFGIKRPATGGGVSALLNNLKKPKINTLKKSLLDWKKFKENNEIEEELDQNRRSKSSFIERQAFLSRTDLRTFEQEKSVRDRIRNLRNT